MFDDNKQEDPQHLPITAAADLVNEHGPFCTRRMSHTFLNHIAAQKRANPSLGYITIMGMSFYSISLMDIFHSTLPCKFMLTESENVPSKFMNNLAFVFWSTMFQDVLDDIVAVLILYKSFSMLVQFIQYGGGLLWHAVLKDTLNHTTAVGMGG